MNTPSFLAIPSFSLTRQTAALVSGLGVALTHDHLWNLSYSSQAKMQGGSSKWSTQRKKDSLPSHSPPGWVGGIKNSTSRRDWGQDAVIQNGHIAISSTAFTLVLRTSSEYPVVSRNPFFFTDSADSSSSQWARSGANPWSSLESLLLIPSEDARRKLKVIDPEEEGFFAVTFSPRWLWEAWLSSPRWPW